MSDQADNLRQLVRARRAWRELVGQSSSAPSVDSGLRPALSMRGSQVQKSRSWARDIGLRLWAARQTLIAPDRTMSGPRRARAVVFSVQQRHERRR
jgi:hypothetical protein